MSTRAKLEGKVTVSSWNVKIDEGSGDVTVSLTDGDYYLSSPGDQSNDLLAHLQAQLNGNGSLSNTYTVSIAAGQAESGKVTLSADASFAVTWSTTDLRDLLGFENDGNLSSASSHTSSDAARALWLPDTPPQTLDGGDSNWAGIERSNFRARIAPAGYVRAQSGQRHARKRIVFPAVTRARTWIVDESTNNQSGERFWLDTVLGEAPWSNRPGGPLRYYPDAKANKDYRTYIAAEWNDYAPNARQSNHVGLWQVDTGMLIEQPSGGTSTISYPADADKLAELMKFAISPTSYRRFTQDSGDAPDLGSGGNALSPANSPTQGTFVSALGSKVVEFGANGEMQGASSSVHNPDTSIAVLWIGIIPSVPGSNEEAWRKRDSFDGHRLKVQANGKLLLEAGDGSDVEQINVDYTSMVGDVIGILASIKSGDISLYVWHNGSVSSTSGSTTWSGGLANSGTYRLRNANDADLAVDAVWENPSTLPGSTELDNLMTGIGFS